MEKPEIKNLGNVPSFFLSGVEGVYRPVRTIFYSLSYNLWGENPLGYHVQALLIHMVISILIFLILDTILKQRTLAFFSALIFAVHPVHTEAVTFITTSFDISGFIFMLLSMFLFFKYTEKRGIFNKKYYILSIILSFIAFLTYELTLTLPILIILADFFFRKFELRKRIKYYIPFFVTAFLYAILRLFVIGIFVKRGTQIEFFTRLFTMSKVIVKYLQLSLFPIDLNVIHTLPFSQSFFDLTVILSVVTIFALLSFSIFVYKYSKVVSFAILWFFISLLPVSNIIPTGILIAERYLYLPSLGFCILMGFVIYKLMDFKKIPQKNAFSISMILLFLIISSFSFLTISRNLDWRNELTLWTKTVSQSPNSADAHYNLGRAYMELGNFDLAFREYNETLRLNPNFAKAYYNRGWMYFQEKKIDLAINEFKKAIEVDKKGYTSYFMLGQCYAGKNMTSLAIEEYKKSISINPNYAKAHQNLGIAYLMEGKYDLAFNELKEAIRINPELPDAHNHLGVTYFYMKECELAKEEFGKAMELDPENEDYRSNFLKVLEFC
jgi:tetratricopeptide (TPR) repeat protein